jgi:hypothetical protein
MPSGPIDSHPFDAVRASNIMEANAEVVEQHLRDGVPPPADFAGKRIDELKVAREWLLAHMTPFEPTISEALLQSDPDQVSLEALRDALRSTAMELRQVSKLVELRGSSRRP